MKIAHECIPCLARQAVEIAQELTTDGKQREEIIQKSLKSLAALNFNETAPEIGYRMHTIAKEVTGIDDPYAALKREYNDIAMHISDKIIENKWMEQSDDPFDLACRIAIAGNIIDFSVGLDLSYDAVLESVETSIQKPVFGMGSKALKQAAEKANRIMFLADNAGEIIFDRFLVENLPLEKVVYVVKGGPIVNDATMEDAVVSGLTEIVEVIDNGYSAQGTILSQCSESFRQAFDSADLIISKGQANFETLSDLADKEIFYLLRAKCISVANAIGCEKMDYVLTKLNTV